MKQRISAEEAVGSPVYRRLTDKWQDEAKLVRGIAFPAFWAWIAINSGLAEVRNVGIIRKRRQLRLHREKTSS